MTRCRGTVYLSLMHSRDLSRPGYSRALFSPDNTARRLRLCFSLRIKRNSENRGLSRASAPPFLPKFTEPRSCRVCRGLYNISRRIISACKHTFNLSFFFRNREEHVNFAHSRYKLGLSVCCFYFLTNPTQVRQLADQ